MKEFIQYIKCLFGWHPMLMPLVLGIDPERATHYDLVYRLRAECLQCRAYFEWFDLTEKQRRELYACDRWVDACWQPIHSPSHVLPHMRLTRKVRLDFCDGPGDAHQDGCPAKPPAAVAQSAEQGFRKAQVEGATPSRRATPETA